MILFFWEVFCCLLTSATVLNLFVPSVRAADEKYIDIPIQEDTYIEENFPTVSPWNNRNLYIGTDIYYGKGRTRTLINFDATIISNLHIRSSDIISAAVNAHVYLFEGSNQTIRIETYTATQQWFMTSITWANQPTISSKKDSTELLTTVGQKQISITNALKAIVDNQTANKGIMLKSNPESEKSLILWAHGCDVAPSPPQCEIASQKPFIRIFYKENSLPSPCQLSLPSEVISNLAEVNLQAAISVDNEGDEIIYEGRICKDFGCEQSEWEGIILSTKKTIIFENEGVHFVSCRANNESSKGIWSVPKQLTIDSTPPIPPTIIQEPTFSPSRENSLFWFPDTEQVTYQVLSSERSNFSSYNTYSLWIPSTSLTILHTKERNYFYKVRSKDTAGNISDWSSTTQTQIDSTTPRINYFKTSKTLVSPKLSGANILEGTAYIQGSISDDTVEEVTLAIYSQKEELVFYQKVTEKNYLWLHWPEKYGYADGTYRVVLTGQDSLERSISSDPIFITLDTTPPNQPRVYGISQGQLLNKSFFTAHITCDADASTSVTLNNRIVAKNESSSTVSRSENDGLKTLEAKCIDKIGNTSLKTINFTIDTIPPATPTLTLERVAETNKITATSYCREDAQIEFFRNGILLDVMVCKKGENTSISITVSNPLPVIIYITARATDKAGNVSGLTERSLFFAAPTSKLEKLESILCALTYNIDKSDIVTSSCSWDKRVDATYKTTLAIDKSYTSIFTILQRNPLVTTELSLVGCQKRTLWNPFTWFGCILEHISTQKVTGTYMGMFSSEIPLTNISQSELQVQHEKVDLINIQQIHMVTLSQIVGSTYIHHVFMSPKQSLAVTPNYSHLTSEKFMTWLFESTVPVSQWHGNTAYQKPHAGIDFSVYKKRVIAPADGTIASVSTHKQSACFGGGDYLAVKHTNGFYTYYFHLSSQQNAMGKTWKINDTVKQGELLALSGNSGMYNCENLAYHLHFELRTSTNTASHVNPVPYMNVDWAQIVTSKAKQNPGRLTGENPHPAY